MSKKHAWSGLVFDWRYEMEDGQVFATRGAIRDVIQWERNHKGESFASKNGRSTTDVMWLGWAALKRKGLTDLDFESFALQVIDFAGDDIERNEDVEDPTGADTSAG